MSLAGSSASDPVRIVGAGLAGCEAAWQIANAGIPVLLIDMKPGRMTPAHHSPLLGELVCSNSLKAMRLTSASGLLKEEMRAFGSLVLEAAAVAQVPAGGSLAVDRELFSAHITRKLSGHPLIRMEERMVEEVPADGIRIVATGPLTQGRMFQSIGETLGAQVLHFFDAAAPIVEADSIDRNRVFAQSRYGRGGDDYLNCPMDREQYERFWHALVEAEVAEVEDFDRKAVYESCMPIETMAARGIDTIRFGPMKPVGLVDPGTGKQPHAVVQLRQDDVSASLFSLVGFQTRLRHPEQKRVFSMIPGLENASFVRYGVMHRNTYIASPGILSDTLEASGHPGLFFAGQMTGVEGYVESAATGLVAGLQAARKVRREPPLTFSARTVTGALLRYVSEKRSRRFQPMNANYGILEPLEGRYKIKEERYQAMAERSLREIKDTVDLLGWSTGAVERQMDTDLV